MYDGKMIFRFDDTNPSKETNEFVDAIFNDLKSLGISWDHFSHTSDHFDFILKVAEETIARGLAYCDNTPQEQMSAERKQKQASRFRDTTPEENLRIFNCMRNAKENVAEGETDYSKYCLRAKIDY
jgi:glutamyl/glutaminyl-tRNA synthetase